MYLNAKNEAVVSIENFYYNINQKKWSCVWLGMTFTKSTLDEIKTVKSNLDKIHRDEKIKISTFKLLYIDSEFHSDHWYKIVYETYIVDENGIMHRKEMVGMIGKNLLDDNYPLDNALTRSELITDPKIIDIILTREKVYPYLGHTPIQTFYPDTKYVLPWNYIKIDGKPKIHDTLEVVLETNEPLTNGKISYSDIDSNEPLMVYRNLDNYMIMAIRFIEIKPKTITEILSSKNDLDAMALAFKELEVIPLEDNVFQVNVLDDCEIYPGLHLEKDSLIKLYF